MLDVVVLAHHVVALAAIEPRIDRRVVAEQSDQVRNGCRRLLAYLADLTGRRSALDGVGRTEHTNLLLQIGRRLRRARRRRLH